jgi:hypothetical protein
LYGELYAQLYDKVLSSLAHLVGQPGEVGGVVAKRVVQRDPDAQQAWPRAVEPLRARLHRHMLNHRLFISMIVYIFEHVPMKVGT